MLKSGARSRIGEAIPYRCVRPPGGKDIVLDAHPPFVKCGIGLIRCHIIFGWRAGERGRQERKKAENIYYEIRRRKHDD